MDMDHEDTLALQEFEAAELERLQQETGGVEQDIFLLNDYLNLVQ